MFKCLCQVPAFRTGEREGGANAARRAAGRTVEAHVARVTAADQIVTAAAEEATILI